MAANREEDDYLSMNFGDAESSSAPETSLQRTARLKREAADRAHRPRKRELAEQAMKARDAALDTALDSSSIGAKMLAKMGFKEGGTLGKSEDALKEPIRVNFRMGKSGIGMEERKPEHSRSSKRNQDELDRAQDARDRRSASLQVHDQSKRQKVSESEYRERVQVSAEERRNLGKLEGAMKVLETLEASQEALGEQTDIHADESTLKHPESASKRHADVMPLRSITVFRRSLARKRLQEDLERTSHVIRAQAIALRGHSCYDNDKPASKEIFLAAAQEELEEEDPELEEFEALSTTEKLSKVVDHLRTAHQYCYWCMGSYQDEEMDGCPGSTEDEHG